jgi:hypothetical protein
MKARLIEGKIKTNSLVDAVKYQIITHLLFKGEEFDTKTVDVLAIVGINGEQSIAHHATELVKRGVRKTKQSARNLITETLKNTKFLKKDREIGGRICLSDDINIVVSEALIINYKVAYVPKES